METPILHKIGLVCTFAALALALTTNRWAIKWLSGPASPFNVVDFTGIYFTLQWAGYLLSIAGLVLSLTQVENIRFAYIGLIISFTLIGFFIATGVATTTDPLKWKSGHLQSLVDRPNK